MVPSTIHIADCFQNAARSRIKLLSQVLYFMQQFMLAIKDLSKTLIAFSFWFLLHSISTLPFHYGFCYIRNQRTLNSGMTATVSERFIKNLFRIKQYTLKTRKLSIVPARLPKTLFRLINIQQLDFKS